ncbi:replication protein RepA [Gluconobacter cerinus]
MTYPHRLEQGADMAEVHHLLMQHGVEETRRLATGDKNARVCVDAAHAVMTDEQQQIGIAHAGFAMAALPHRKTASTVWERDGGPVKLLVESGLDSQKNPVGIPYGSVARLILLYLQTQAVRNRSRDVELGASMNAWLAAMNLTVGGKTYRLVKEQSRRISRCRLTFFRQEAGAEFVSNGAFVRDAIFPIETINSAQPSLWHDVVRLDESFYQSLIEHPLPLREIAIRQISGKSMAIDIYVWLAYRLHVLSVPVKVTWAALKSQFGPEYKELRFFRRDVMPSLKLALSVYPEANVDIDDKMGLTLHPSPPPVAERVSRIRS